MFLTIQRPNDNNNNKKDQGLFSSREATATPETTAKFRLIFSLSWSWSDVEYNTRNMEHG